MKENLSQRVLLEVLTKEIETLKKSTEVVKHSLPTIEKRLSEMKNTKVEVDASKIDEALSSHKTPNWILYVLLACFVLTSASFIFGAIQYKNNQHEKRASAHWFSVAVEHGYESK